MRVNLHLKMFKECVSLTSLSTKFHVDGPAFGNALAPNLHSFATHDAHHYNYCCDRQPVKVRSGLCKFSVRKPWVLHEQNLC